MTADQFDVVIVGSGFGGSVMAYNLSKAGMKVCLLERGKTYPPGNFPRSLDQMKNAFWQPEKGLLGLYDFWSFKDSDAITCSGLGGGSLIYANVLLRKDPEWFDGWPITYQDLVPHYDRVEEVLKPVPYPFDKTPYNQTVKTSVLKEAAAAVGMPFDLVPIAITFGNDVENPVPGEQLHHAENLTRRGSYCGSSSSITCEEFSVSIAISICRLPSASSSVWPMALYQASRWWVWASTSLTA